MKFVVAGYGSRGDVEPCAAVALELLRRGHDVRMAVSPNMLDFVESAGVAAVVYGPDWQAQLNDQNVMGNFWALRNSWKAGDPLSVVPKVAEHLATVWTAKSRTLTSLADGADLLLAGMTEQGLAANVADYHGIPLAGLHFFPAQILERGWLHSLITKDATNAQRRALGLPEVTGPSIGSLEIQAYDELCLPGLTAQWARDGRRPFVGALTCELPTNADDEVLSWIAAGTPPIYYGLGSTPIKSPEDTVMMIIAACTQLGERALICSGPNDFTGIPHFDHVKVVHAVNHSAIFPACRAVVQHGGAGTTAAALRAGIPTLILWLWLDQPVWAGAVERLQVGFGRRFSETTVESLVADVRSLLAPQYAAKAREVAAQMTKPAKSLASAADLLEVAARRGRVE
jgi:UDP:flavonoid glycosyltransferase YjiC (YdhE family)